MIAGACNMTISQENGSFCSKGIGQMFSLKLTQHQKKLVKDKLACWGVVSYHVMNGSTTPLPSANQSRQSHRNIKKLFIKQKCYFLSKEWRWMIDCINCHAWIHPIENHLYKIKFLPSSQEDAPPLSPWTSSPGMSQIPPAPSPSLRQRHRAQSWHHHLGFQRSCCPFEAMRCSALVLWEETCVVVFFHKKKKNCWLGKRVRRSKLFSEYI